MTNDETLAERTRRITKETLADVRTKVDGGMSPEEAINRTAKDATSYSAALKEYGLKPVIPD